MEEKIIKINWEIDLLLKALFNRSKKHKFSVDLPYGQNGENIISKLFNLVRLDGMNGDLYCPITKCKIEVKTDNHKSKNFFIELNSNFNQKNIGGPWQALSKGCDFYFYYFPKMGEIYIFRTIDLIRKIESNDELREWTHHVNGDYNDSYGYIINKESLSDIYCKITMKIENEHIILKKS